MMNSGIYTITNLIDNKFIIGYTNNFNKREEEHFRKLRNNQHNNPYLQNSVNYHGVENFKFEKLEECDLEYLASQENYWCNLLDSHNREIGYNIRSTHPDNKSNLSEESKNKISKTLTGRKLNIETTEKRIRTTKERYKDKGILLKNKNRKNIYQINKLGTIIKEWKAPCELKEAGFHPSNVVLVCKNKRKSHKGFTWKYKELIN